MVAGGTIFYKAAESIWSQQAAATELHTKWRKNISGKVAQEIEKIVLRAIIEQQVFRDSKIHRVAE